MVEAVLRTCLARTCKCHILMTKTNASDWLSYLLSTAPPRQYLGRLCLHPSTPTHISKAAHTVSHEQLVYVSFQLMHVTWQPCSGAEGAMAAKGKAKITGALTWPQE